MVSLKMAPTDSEESGIIGGLALLEVCLGAGFEALKAQASPCGLSLLPAYPYRDVELSAPLQHRAACSLTEECWVLAAPGQDGGIKTLQVQHRTGPCFCLLVLWGCREGALGWLVLVKMKQTYVYLRRNLNWNKKPKTKRCLDWPAGFSWWMTDRQGAGPLGATPTILC